MAVKYFQSKIGNVVSNGKTKVKFPIAVIAISDEKQIELLKTSANVKEITAEEAQELYPTVFVDIDGDSTETTGDDGEGTKAVLVDEAIDLGITQKELKQAKNRAQLIELVKKARQAKAEEEKIKTGNTQE